MCQSTLWWCVSLLYGGVSVCKSADCMVVCHSVILQTVWWYVTATVQTVWWCVSLSQYRLYGGVSVCYITDCMVVCLCHSTDCMVVCQSFTVQAVWRYVGMSECILLVGLSVTGTYSIKESIKLCCVWTNACLWTVVRSTFRNFDRGHTVVLIVKLQVYIYTGCFMTLGHNCRRWFPRFLWSKKFI